MVIRSRFSATDLHTGASLTKRKDRVESRTLGQRNLECDTGGRLYTHDVQSPLLSAQQEQVRDHYSVEHDGGRHYFSSVRIFVEESI